MDIRFENRQILQIPMNTPENTNLFSLLLFLIVFSGCRQQAGNFDVEKTIADVTSKFPQLPKGTSRQTEYYKLIRTVITGEKNVQLQLWSTPPDIKDTQQIITITNSQGQHYAIPFFSNTYRDYWNFQSDSLLPDISKTNTTFENEFVTALNVLNLHDTLRTGEMVFYETLISLLNCRQVSANDSLAFLGMSWANNYDLPPEDSDSCRARSIRNFEAIKKEIYPNSPFYYTAFLDAQNNGIYQIKIKRRQSKNFDLAMKIYRQDCIIHILTM